MLQAYFDESGIDTRTPSCVVAGYVGGIGQWRKFEKLWKLILKKSEVEEFHAKRFFARDPYGNRVDEYRNWSDQEANTFIDCLTACIGKFKIHPVSCSVINAEWKKLSYGERRVLTGGTYIGSKFKSSGAPSKTYFFPFQFCIITATDLCGTGQKVHFAFDLNREYHGYSRDLFKILKNLPKLECRDKLGEPSWPTSLEAVQLQAADLLAYLLIQHNSEKMKDRHASPSKLLRAITAGLLDLHHMLYLDRDAIQKCLAKCSHELRAGEQPVQPKRIKRPRNNV